MLISGDVLHGRQIRRAVIPQRTITLNWVPGAALAMLIAGSVVGLPTLAVAATQDAKPASTSAPAAGNAKVSPYTIAMRRHNEEATAAGEHTTKHPVGQPMQSKTSRPKRH